MNSNCKVSIVIPVYNTEKYIMNCVNSVKKQTHKNIEIILVDDESPDNCPQICDELSSTDQRIKVIHKKNSGLGLTRNAGMDVATGEYITFLDSDDWIEKDHISNLVRAFDCETDLVIGAYKTCTDSGEIICFYSNEGERMVYGKEDVNRIAYSMIAPERNEKKELSLSMSVCFNLYKLSIIRKNQIEFPSEKLAVGEDLFFNLNYIEFCKQIKIINNEGYNYRWNTESITRKFDENRFNRTMMFYNNLMNTSWNYIDDDEFRFRVKRGTLAKIRVSFKLLVGSKETLSYKYINLKKYLRDRRLKEVLCDFPIGIYRPSIRLTTIFMKYRLTLLVLLMLLLKNWSETTGHHA